jgi:tetratricopeptide (TPR) repeat protein
VKKACIAFAFVWLLAVVAAPGATPDVGKEELRKLIKLPTIVFQSDWTFDVERGFALGSQAQDERARIADLESGLKGDTGDAQAEAELGELYQATGDGESAQKAWTAAAEFYRKRVEAQSDDGALLAGFGLSLEGAGNTAEAESVLRRAVQVAPKEWQCRVALGKFLDREARRSMMEGAADKPAADDVSLAQSRMTEAGECFDRAVALAPKEPEVWFRRGMHRCAQRMVLNQIHVASGGPDAPSDIFENCFSPESLADLQEAGRLSPGDYELIATTALFEVYTIVDGKGQVGISALTWDVLPAKSQTSLHEALVRLENLGQAGDPRTAAPALEALGILQGPVLHQHDRCIATMRQALALAPSREHAWEVLMATLAQAGRYDELLTVCEEQVRMTNSARTHLLLAKAHEKLKQWNDAEQEARTAAMDNPGDFTADLSLAALLLKHSGDDATTLADADDWLRRAEIALSNVPPLQRSREEVIELTLTRGIYFALTDEMDTARKFVKTVIERDKDNHFAREILSAMDY